MSPLRYLVVSTVKSRATLAAPPDFSELDYCALCSWIILSILALTAPRLNDAGSCIGG